MAVPVAAPGAMGVAATPLMRAPAALALPWQGPEPITLPVATSHRAAGRVVAGRVVAGRVVVGRVVVG
ncbi:MAG: hypothetical protein AB1673_16400, partial [Actinomycetota bacterium]